MSAQDIDSGWPLKVVKHIKEIGFNNAGFTDGKPTFKRGEDTVIICSPCGWFSHNGKKVKMFEVPNYLKTMA